MIDPSLPATLAAVALALLWTAERAFPMFVHAGAPRVPWRHDVRNTALGLFNAALAAAFFAGLTLGVTTWARAHGFGLLAVLPWDGLPALLAGVLLLDLWAYAWHRLAHRLPALWRLHRVHHSDEALSVTTALRFHTGEILLSSSAWLVVLPLLGLSLEHVLLYQAVLLPSTLLHHANVRLPERVDRVARVLLVTPRMHWLHHSRDLPEGDSNYAAIVSLWDRLFGTFRMRRDLAGLRLGLGADGGARPLPAAGRAPGR